MTDQIKSPNKITRRKLAKLAIAGTVIGPATWGVALKLKDNPLPEISEPNLIFEGGWVLDNDDTSDDEVIGNTE